MMGRMMKIHLPFALMFCMVAGCSAQENAAAYKSGNARSAAAVSKENHPFVKVNLGYGKEGCSFDASPIDFCDEQHMRFINAAIKKQKPNFNQHYILLSVPVWPEYYQHSLMAIDISTGIVYPVPIDVYSGPLDKKGNPKKNGKLTFALNNKQVCIEGAILVYRSIKEGKFCFSMQGNKFVGHHTAYME
jgi:hypothetical protein